MGEYKAYGVQTFTSKLILELTWRMQDFAIYVSEKQRKNPEICQLKSKQEWIQEYTTWCKGNSK